MQFVPTRSAAFTMASAGSARPISPGKARFSAPSPSRPPSAPRSRPSARLRSRPSARLRSRQPSPRRGDDSPLPTADDDRVPNSAQRMVVPLALAQFIASYAATNMNVAISTIAGDIGTSVRGMQTAITLFTLTMAALMIPGSKLTGIWGRKVCFVAGLVIYGTGALLAALAQGLGLMITGYSILEGVGSALLIPPIYILITVAFPDVKSRAKNFGAVSGAAGLG